MSQNSTKIHHFLYNPADTETDRHTAKAQTLGSFTKERKADKITNIQHQSEQRFKWSHFSN